MRIVLCYSFFFFSSRRRYTRWNCDWSSDVCSSDLEQPFLLGILVVVRADTLAGVELVHRAAELLGADRRAEAGHPRPVARRVGRIALGLDLVEVHDLPHSPSQ